MYNNKDTNDIFQSRNICRTIEIKNKILINKLKFYRVTYCKPTQLVHSTQAKLCHELRTGQTK